MYVVLNLVSSSLHENERVWRRDSQSVGAYELSECMYSLGSGVSAAGARLNPFGSTLLQNAAFGSLPGAERSAEPQIGISDFQ